MQENKVDLFDPISPVSQRILRQFGQAA